MNVQVGLRLSCHRMHTHAQLLQYPRRGLVQSRAAHRAIEVLVVHGSAATNSMGLVGMWKRRGKVSPSHDQDCAIAPRAEATKL